MRIYSKPIENFSGWSDQYCETCGKVLTNAALKWSLKVYEKKLCGSCQNLERYLKEYSETKEPEPYASAKDAEGL